MLDFARASPARTKREGHAHCTRPIAYVAFVVLLGFLFIRPLTALIGYAAQTDLHSHILLVPFISLYLMYIQRGKLPQEYATSLTYALISFVVGLIALLAAWSLVHVGLVEGRNDYLSLITFGFVCFLVSGGFLILGCRWMKAAALPIGFLIFMVPLPDQILHLLETASQTASTEAAMMLFTITGTPIMRDGAVFQLPGIAIEVAQECSGIRSSWVLFITTLVAAYLFLQSPWRRALLIAFVIPLAIVRNGFRILVIGLLCVEMGPQMIHSMIHRQGGPLFFALSLIPLFLLLRYLRKGEAVHSKP